MPQTFQSLLFATHRAGPKVSFVFGILGPALCLAVATWRGGFVFQGILVNGAMVIAMFALALWLVLGSRSTWLAAGLAGALAMGTVVSGAFAYVTSFTVILDMAGRLRFDPAPWMVVLLPLPVACCWVFFHNAAAAFQASSSVGILERAALLMLGAVLTILVPARLQRAANGLHGECVAAVLGDDPRGAEKLVERCRPWSWTMDWNELILAYARETSWLEVPENPRAMSIAQAYRELVGEPVQKAVGRRLALLD